MKNIYFKYCIILLSAIFLFKPVFSSENDKLAPASTLHKIATSLTLPAETGSIDDTYDENSFANFRKNTGKEGPYKFLDELKKSLERAGCVKFGEGGMGSVYKYTIPATKDAPSQEIVIKLPNIIEHGILKSLYSENSQLKKNQGMPGTQQPFPLQPLLSSLNVNDIRDAHLRSNLALMHSYGFAVISKMAPGLPLSDYIRGKDSQKILADPKFRIRFAIAVISEISKTLRAMHRDGRIFCDLKPDNIIVDYDPVTDKFTVTLIDFGITTSNAAIRERMKSESIRVVGTLLYMSPEQMGFRVNDRIKADSYYDYSSFDTYAIAMTLFSIMTGVLDYAGNIPGASTKTPPLELMKKARYIELLKARLKNSLSQTVSMSPARLPGLPFKILKIIKSALKIISLELSLYREYKNHERSSKTYNVRQFESFQEFLVFKLMSSDEEDEEKGFFPWFEAMFPEDMKNRSFDSVKHVIYNSIHPDFNKRTKSVGAFSLAALNSLRILLEKIDSLNIRPAAKAGETSA